MLALTAVFVIVFLVEHFLVPSTLLISPRSTQWTALFGAVSWNLTTESVVIASVSHYSFGHLLKNMWLLLIIGLLYEEHLNSSTLFLTYILGIAWGLVLVPVSLQSLGQRAIHIGASGGLYSALSFAASVLVLRKSNIKHRALSISILVVAIVYNTLLMHLNGIGGAEIAHLGAVFVGGTFALATNRRSKEHHC